MKILVGYDGSNQAKEALNVAKKHAQAFNADVYVVTSLVGEDETTTEDIRKAEEELEYAKSLL
ncbi:MAG: universal stress protein, partial [Thermodesulfobacteriota bacterium]